MTTVSHGKPYAGNLHVRFEEGDSASAEPRRKSLLHKNIIFAVCVFACAALHSYADVTVSDVKVFSGYPWKEVVVGYTITGTTAETDMIKLTATDKSANKTYTAQSLTGA